MVQLDGLVQAGNTVIVVEHEMRVVAGSDWVIDVGPGAGEEGGKIVASGPPAEVAMAEGSKTAPYLARFLSPRSSAQAFKRPPNSASRR
jgi:excinuclease ABC subunit A